MHKSSFRDPAGFMFTDKKGRLLRQVNKTGAKDFDLLHSSGLYDALIAKGWLVPHTLHDTKGAHHAMIEPERVPFITYPFEWSFSQLQDAALLTLKVQKLALKHGMSLKDASAYNVQFMGYKPVFIDTLSFEAYQPGNPWKAYRQFCQHFLAPLAVMSHTDVRLSQLLRVYVDGIPLDLCARLLPRRTYARLGLAMHLHLHARMQRTNAASQKDGAKVNVPQERVEAILQSLRSTVRAQKPPKSFTEWGDYYNNTNYTSAAADAKADLLRELIKPLKAQTVLDFGGNDGHYSRALHPLGTMTICADYDPNAVQINYNRARAEKDQLMLPLLVDLTNPGGAIGWANEERQAINQRLQADVVVALAVVHHLAISNNLPLEHIARYFATFAPHLVIEFVPKEDSQVQKLLASREDIFPNYTKKGFEAAFSKTYTLVRCAPIPGTARYLYSFARR